LLIKFKLDIKIQSLTLNLGMQIITVRLYRVTPSFRLAATHTVALTIFVSRFDKALSENLVLILDSRLQSEVKYNLCTFPSQMS